MHVNATILLKTNLELGKFENMVWIHSFLQKATLDNLN